MKKLIIVESPTKAKTIKKFLGREYTVLACMGHVRDLPDKASEIPAQYKKLKWARLGVNIEDKFKPLYVVSGKKTKIISELRKALADSDSLLLATDEDREGESISWHLLEVLKPKIPTKRMVFHEITKPAIEEALANPRDIDMQLVHAQEARRILDRLVGYTISPLIWKKIAYGLSAGRVQSVALKALVDLEKERMKFVNAKYWGVLAELSKEGKEKNTFEARLTQLNGKKIAAGKDFDETTGKLKTNADAMLLSHAQADKIITGAKSGGWKVLSVEEKPVNRKPAPPFITSTLQQEANRKMGLSARETMRIAQSLYERGFITYMRTDSTNLSESAIKSSRTQVERLYGKDYVSPEPRRYTKKSKGAQEAHEAIRPSLDFTPPQEMGLRGREYDIYEMIWMRTIATQMAESRQLQVSANIVVDTPEGKATFHSSGMKILFPGFLMAYVEGEDDPEEALAKKERFLPDFKKDDVVKHMNSEVTEHETKPPARYTEASLIQFLEKEGIGRPSTYASIVSTILDRGYAQKTGNALVPTFTGFAVTGLMDRHFQEFVNNQFTSNMEEKLDDIAEGKLDYLPYLSRFYLGKDGLQNKVEIEDKKINPEEARELNFGHIKNLHVYVGKYGPYFEYIDPKTKEKVKASIPNNISPSDLNEDSIHSIVEQVKKGDQALAIDPETKKQIFLRTGQYGPYLQLGEISDDPKEKLKRVSIPKGVDPNNIDEKTAIAIIGLPRLLGKHPQTGKDIRASVGRFGPYIVHDGDFRSLKKDDSVLEVDLARAMELLAQEKKGGRRGSQALKELGKHPDGNKVELMQGPYGIYVKHGKVNATVPKEKNADEVTLDLALQLLAAKAADGGTKSAARGAKRGSRRSKSAARS